MQFSKARLSVCPGHGVSEGTMATMAAYPLTVGFDLDMTLIDSRPGIKAAYQALTAGPAPISTPTPPSPGSGRRWSRRSADWFPEERVAEISEVYRELYPEHAIAGTLAMPGAREAIAAVHARGRPGHRGHRQVRAERQAAPRRTWASRRTPSSARCGRRPRPRRCANTGRGSTSGTTPATSGARTPRARCPSPSPPARARPEELREAGAEVLLDDLTHFPAWLDGHVTQGAEAASA